MGKLEGRGGLGPESGGWVEEGIRGRREKTATGQKEVAA